MTAAPRVLFYDVNVSGVRRFPVDISRRIVELASDAVLDAGYLIEDGDPDAETAPLDGVEHVTAGYRGWVRERQPDVVVLFSHRIPELILLAVCRDLAVSTMMVQHGIFVDMHYGPGAFISEKAARYLRLLPELVREANLPLSRIVKPWDLQDRSDHADRALVYGDGYVDFFQERYGYPQEACTVVGYPDYDGWQPGCLEPGICYIAQSLVEDGRVDRSRFMDFVTVLARVADEIPMIVKLHPRSDLSLYEPLLDLDVPMVRHGDLPERKVYVSHSTTLLAKAFRVTSKVLLWRFQGVDVPDFFRRWSAAECDDADELVERARRLHSAEASAGEVQEDEIDRWFEMNEKGTWRDIARHVLAAAEG